MKEQNKITVFDVDTLQDDAAFLLGYLESKYDSTSAKCAFKLKIEVPENEEHDSVISYVTAINELINSVDIDNLPHLYSFHNEEQAKLNRQIIDVRLFLELLKAWYDVNTTDKFYLEFKYYYTKENENSETKTLWADKAYSRLFETPTDAILFYQENPHLYIMEMKRIKVDDELPNLLFVAKNK